MGTHPFLLSDIDAPSAEAVGIWDASIFIGMSSSTAQGACRRGVIRTVGLIRVTIRPSLLSSDVDFAAIRGLLRGSGQQTEVAHD